MTEYQSRSKLEVLEFINLLSKSKNNRLLTLNKLAIELIETPSSFDYDFWCGEGFLSQYRES